MEEVTMFIVPTQPIFSSADDSETISNKIKYLIYNQASAAVVLSVRVLPIDNGYGLRDITIDHIDLLKIRFDNVHLLETSYDTKSGEMTASRLVYTYSDQLENQLDKKGIEVIYLKGDKEITITYSTQSQDFDTFLLIVNKMIDTFRSI